MMYSIVFKNGNKYTWIELATGASEDFKKYNIYDMAGNMWEFTSSHNIEDDEMFGVIRGGGYSAMGDTQPVTRANNGTHPATNASVDVGFRVVLYVI